MALLLKPRKRRMDDEDRAAASTPAESSRSTLRSIFRRLRPHSPLPNAVGTTPIFAAHSGTASGYLHVHEAEHSLTRTTAPSYHMSPADSSRSRIYGLDRVKAVVRAVSRKPRTTLSSSRSSITASGSRPRYATAADIPPELYDLILFFMERPLVGASHRGEQLERNTVVVGKRKLGQLGLVCWSWAGMCQAKMYEVLTLRSLDDFRELETLATHRCSRISQYIQHLQFNISNERRPWVHTVCLKVRPHTMSPKREGPQFPNYTGHLLVLRGSKGLAVLKRGLHAALPRRVPSIFSQGIMHLDLGRMELPGTGEVVRLSRALPALEQIAFWNVTWAAPPSTDAEAYASLVRWRPGKQTALVEAIQMAGCTEAWVVLPLLCLLDASRSLCAEELAAVAKMARTLTTSVEKTEELLPLTRAMREEWGYQLSVHATEDRVLAPYLFLSTVHDAAVGHWRIDVIVLDCVSPDESETVRPLPDMVDYSWKSFDRHAASLPSLRHVIIGLWDRDELSLVAKVIEPKMPKLSSSQRLKYALWYDDPSKVPTNGWVACVPDKAADKDLIDARRVGEDRLYTLYS